MESEDITVDHFYKGEVTILQGRRGYRFAVDSPILADFLPGKPDSKALEIGTGAGIISMLALYKKKFSFIYGLEIQEKLSRLAEINAQKNGFSVRFKVINGDFNENYLDFAGITEVFSNPPFQKLDSGRLSADAEIRDARFETRLNLKDLLTKCRAILAEKGNLYLIYPYSRFVELTDLARGIGLNAARIRFIFPFKDEKPDRFLVQLTTYNYEISTINMEPLIIFKEKGRYTDEMENIFSGR